MEERNRKFRANVLQESWKAASYKSLQNEQQYNKLLNRLKLLEQENKQLKNLENESKSLLVTVDALIDLNRPSVRCN